MLSPGMAVWVVGTWIESAMPLVGSTSTRRDDLNSIPPDSAMNSCSEMSMGAFRGIRTVTMMFLRSPVRRVMFFRVISSQFPNEVRFTMISWDPSFCMAMVGRRTSSLLPLILRSKGKASTYSITFTWMTSESLAPDSSVTVRVTLYVPGSLKKWFGCS